MLFMLLFYKFYFYIYYELHSTFILSSFLVVDGGRVNLDPVALSWLEAEIVITDFDKEIIVREGRPQN